MQDRKWELEVGQRRERTATEAVVVPAEAETTSVRTAPDETREQDLPWKWRPKPLMTCLLQFGNGNTRGVRYYDILVQDHLGGEIILYCERYTVMIKGRHLEHLLLLLADDRALIIEEQHKPEWKDDSSKPYIEAITIGKPCLDALTSAPRRSALG